MHKLTTKALKTHFLFGLEPPKPLNEYCSLKFIDHPKERENEFFILHDVVMSGHKAWAMKMRDNANCDKCGTIQDTKHIFKTCVNAQAAWKALEELEDQIPGDQLINNKSLVKRCLFTHKDIKFTKEMAMHSIKLRIEDFEKIGNNNSNKTLLKTIKKANLKIMN